MSFQRILVPTDGTEAAHEAARVGVELAEPLGATLVFLGVADVSLATSNTYIASADEGRVIAKLREEAEENVGRISDEISSTAVNYETVVEEGVPEETIVEYAENDDIDLVVMGTHGRRGIEWFLMGSVTERVLQTASMPVMRVREEESPE